MLRGQGSLKELLGQNVVSASYARKKRLKAAAEASAAVATEPAAKRRAGPASSKSAPVGTEAAADAAARLFAKAQRNASKPDPQSSDLTTVRPDAADAATPSHGAGNGPSEMLLADCGRSGSVAPATVQQPASERSRAGAGGSTPICCPICGRALSESSGAINSHIDHCLARSASAKRVKQRTVTALFGSASAAAAKRCRAMLNDNAVQQQAALRSTSAPPEIQLPQRQHQQQQQQYAGMAIPAHAALQTAAAMAEPGPSPPGAVHAVSNEQAAQCRDGCPAAPESAATSSMLDLLNQPTQPLDAMLQLRQQHDLANSAEGDGLRASLAGQPRTTSEDAAASKVAATTASGDPPPAPAAATAAPLAAMPPEADAAGLAQAEDAGQAEPDAEAGMHTPQRQIISRQSVLPCASPLATVKSFTTCVVGRRFQTEAECTDGEPVTIQHEPSNTRDRNALLVIGSRNQVLGHLAAEVAKWLCPLVVGNMVEVAGTVQDEPTSASSPITVNVQIGFSQDMLLLSPRKQNRLHANLKKAAQAAAEVLKRQGRRLGPGGAGECLRANFRLVTDTVRSSDGHLLSAEEHAMLDTFHALPEQAQCLFLRLYQRRGPWFRQRALEYPEVGNAADAIVQLGGAGFLAMAEDSDTAELVQMLTIPELKALAVGLDLKMGGRNSGNRDLILAWYNRTVLAPPNDGVAPAVAPDLLAAQLEALVGPCCRLTGGAAALMARVRRLFFMSEHQDLSRFLVTNLGITKYPQYILNRPSSGFQRRSDMLEYEAALQHASALDTAFEDGNIAAAEAALAPAWVAIAEGRHKAAAFAGNLAATHPFLRGYSAAWVYATMATAGVSLLEKQRKYVEATDILRQLLGGVCCSGRRGEWWTRLSIDTERMGRIEEALEVAEAALADEAVKTGDRLALQRRVLRLGKPPRRWRRPPWAAAAAWEPPHVTIVGKPIASVVGLKSKFLSASGEQVTVEQFALEHYATEDGGGWQGMHSEGGVWATLWGLLMWPVLFAEVPEVFRTPFQSAPLDLGTDAFFAAREPAIRARLQEIRDGRAVDIIRDAWAEHEGTVCRGVNWERQPLEELAAIAECVGGAGLAALCHLLAEDHSGWAGGMPDLLLWRPADRRAKLSEVKGPRDRLSEQQRAWAAALSGAGLQVEVLKVVETLPKKR